MIKRVFTFFLDSVQALVLALSVFVLLYLFVAQPNQVRGNSMLPNFHDKEYLLTEKITYRMRDPQRGEVVILKAPPSEPCSEDECEYIKRIIGLPGETVKISGGKVWINGRVLEEGYLPEGLETNPGSYLQSGRRAVIPRDEYLVMGDNRNHSRDGREFGPIPRENIVGRAVFRYWPPDKMGVIKQGEY